MSRGRVLVAMSGGVDSSVAAWLLLRQGYECVGATMRLAPNEDDRPGERTCCSVDDVADARAACWRLGIRHYVFDYTREFDRDVIAPFVAAYEAGTTPNPCVACNRHLKFGALLDRALDLGCDYLATGHYARVARDGAMPAGEHGARAGAEAGADNAGASIAGAEYAGAGMAEAGAAGSGASLGGNVQPADRARPERARETGRLHLLKGVDAAKDQSYFLFGLTQERLAHVLLPLGGLVKATQVRRLAEEAGLAVAHKRDSEGICFVPGGDHARFIEERTGHAAGEGEILDTQGHVLGHHHGALRYTLGQRKGLGVASDRPLYVCALDVGANTVTLGNTADLMSRELVASDWNWISGTAPTVDGASRATAARASGNEAQPAKAASKAGDVPWPIDETSAGTGFRASAKVRYHQPDQPCVIYPQADDHVRIVFDEPQRAVTPGQAVVVYRGEELLGGGTILRTVRARG